MLKRQKGPTKNKWTLILMNLPSTQNLSMKVVCLFVCDIEILQNHDAPLCTFATIGYPLMIKGSLNWFHNVSAYGGKVIKY